MAKAPGFKQVLKAVFGAIVGVQSEQQRQQDFQGRLTAGTERYNLSVHLNMKV